MYCNELPCYIFPKKWNSFFSCVTFGLKLNKFLREPPGYAFPPWTILNASPGHSLQLSQLHDFLTSHCVISIFLTCEGFKSTVFTKKKKRGMLTKNDLQIPTPTNFRLLKFDNMWISTCAIISCTITCSIIISFYFSTL